MKKKIVAGIIALMMTAGMAMFVGPASAGSSYKVVHNGHTLCIGEKGVYAHWRHDDDAESGLVPCSKKATKKKATKKKKKVAKRKIKK